MTVKEFLKLFNKLARAGYYRVRDKHGAYQIRFTRKEESFSFCPITAVCHMLQGYKYKTSAYQTAAWTIGLSPIISGQIANCADHSSTINQFRIGVAELND